MSYIMAKISEKVMNCSSNLDIIEIAIKGIIAELSYERKDEVQNGWYKLREGLEELNKSQKLDDKTIVEAVFRLVKEFDIYKAFNSFIMKFVQ